MLVGGQSNFSGTTTQTVAPQLATHASPLASTSNTNLDLLSAFECPVCMDYMLPPYLQCQAGHLVCGNCRPKVTCCKLVEANRISYRPHVSWPNSKYTESCDGKNR